MKDKWKRKLAFLAAFIIVLSSRMLYEPPLEYERLENSPAFGRYSGGLIYIGDDKYNCPFPLTDGDVYVVDQRDSDDPNLKVVDSYKVKTYKERSEILKVLCDYEECYPSNWDRTYESMQLEWYFHNRSYEFEYKRKSSTDVDLNNADESQYNNKILQKLLK